MSGKILKQEGINVGTKRIKTSHRYRMQGKLICDGWNKFGTLSLTK